VVANDRKFLVHVGGIVAAPLLVQDGGHNARRAMRQPSLSSLVNVPNDRTKTGGRDVPLDEE
jgi:hypothetical protein